MSINCHQLNDGDLPLPDGAFPPLIYDSIFVTSSPNLTSFPANSFGQGVIAKSFLTASTAVSHYDPQFLGDENMVQHIEEMTIHSDNAK